MIEEIYLLIRRLLAASITLVLLAACAKPGPSSLPSETPQLEETPLYESTPAPEIEDSMDKPGDNEGQPVVVYQRSGGITGMIDEWRIYLDGRIEGPRDNQRKVTREEVLDLLVTMRRNGFSSLNASYVPSDTCCDRFTHVITVYLDEDPHTVTTLDAAPDQPHQLTAVLNAINKVIAAD